MDENKTFQYKFVTPDNAAMQGRIEYPDSGTLNSMQSRKPVSQLLYPRTDHLSYYPETRKHNFETFPPVLKSIPVSKTNYDDAMGHINSMSSRKAIQNQANYNQSRHHNEAISHTNPVTCRKANYNEATGHTNQMPCRKANYNEANYNQFIDQTNPIPCRKSNYNQATDHTNPMSYRKAHYNQAIEHSNFTTVNSEQFRKSHEQYLHSKLLESNIKSFSNTSQLDSLSRTQVDSFHERLEQSSHVQSRPVDSRLRHSDEKGFGSSRLQSSHRRAHMLENQAFSYTYTHGDVTSLHRDVTDKNLGVRRSDVVEHHPVVMQDNLYHHQLSKNPVQTPLQHDAALRSSIKNDNRVLYPEKTRMVGSSDQTFAYLGHNISTRQKLELYSGSAKMDNIHGNSSVQTTAPLDLSTVSKKGPANYNFGEEKQQLDDESQSPLDLSVKPHKSLKRCADPTVSHFGVDAGLSRPKQRNIELNDFCASAVVEHNQTRLREALKTREPSQIHFQQAIKTHEHNQTRLREALKTGEYNQIHFQQALKTHEHNQIRSHDAIKNTKDYIYPPTHHAKDRTIHKYQYQNNNLESMETDIKQRFNNRTNILSAALTHDNMSHQKTQQSLQDTMVRLSQNPVLSRTSMISQTSVSSRTSVVSQTPVVSQTHMVSQNPVHYRSIEHAVTCNPNNSNIGSPHQMYTYKHQLQKNESQPLLNNRELQSNPFKFNSPKQIAPEVLHNQHSQPNPFKYNSAKQIVTEDKKHIPTSKECFDYSAKSSVQPVQMSLPSSYVSNHPKASSSGSGTFANNSGTVRNSLQQKQMSLHHSSSESVSNYSEVSSSNSGTFANTSGTVQMSLSTSSVSNHPKASSSNSSTFANNSGTVRKETSKRLMIAEPHMQLYPSNSGAVRKETGSGLMTAPEPHMQLFPSYQKQTVKSRVPQITNLNSEAFKSTIIPKNKSSTVNVKKTIVPPIQCFVNDSNQKPEVKKPNQPDASSKPQGFDTDEQSYNCIKLMKNSEPSSSSSREENVSATSAKLLKRNEPSSTLFREENVSATSPKLLKRDELSSRASIAENVKATPLKLLGKNEPSSSTSNEENVSAILPKLLKKSDPSSNAECVRVTCPKLLDKNEQSSSLTNEDNVSATTPKFLSRKQIIMNAVSQDENLRNYAKIVPQAIQKARSIISEFKSPLSPSSPPSPRMPILSPQQKLLPSVSPLHSDPPTLDLLDQSSKQRLTGRLSQTLSKCAALEKSNAQSVNRYGNQGQLSQVSKEEFPKVTYKKPDSVYRRRNKNIPVANVAPFVHSEFKPQTTSQTTSQTNTTENQTQNNEQNGSKFNDYSFKSEPSTSKQINFEKVIVKTELKNISSEKKSALENLKKQLMDPMNQLVEKRLQERQNIINFLELEKTSIVNDVNSILLQYGANPQDSNQQTQTDPFGSKDTTKTLKAQKLTKKAGNQITNQGFNKDLNVDVNVDDKFWEFRSSCDTGSLGDECNVLSDLPSDPEEDVEDLFDLSAVRILDLDLYNIGSTCKSIRSGPL